MAEANWEQVLSLARGLWQRLDDELARIDQMKHLIETDSELSETERSCQCGCLEDSAWHVDDARDYLRKLYWWVSGEPIDPLQEHLQRDA